MTLSLAAFWLLAVVLVGSALAVVLTKNLFHSVLWLALALTGTAGLFLTLNAEFLAAVQLLLYAGGVITIVVFAIVVTERLVAEKITQSSRRIGGGAVLAVTLLVVLVRIITQASLTEAPPAAAEETTRRIGESLLTRHALSLEVLAVLLLASLIGAIYFARPED